MNTLTEATLKDIAYSLDRNKARGNEEYWRLLIPLLPKQLYRYDKVDVEKFAYEGTKGRSPSLKLLQEFQRKGMGCSDFVQMLEKIGCQGALDCFREPEKPIILEHPESKTVNVNERLELQCIAKCIPEPPDYQWFYYHRDTAVAIKGAKSWKFIIEKVTMNSTRYYCCRVQNRRIKDGAEFSRYAQVIVTESELVTSGTLTGTNNSITPVQEITDRMYGTLLSRSPASLSTSCDTDGTTSIQITHPEQSTDSVGTDQLIDIVLQPENQTVRLKKAEDMVKLYCRGQSPIRLPLAYKWYYLRGNETPKTIDRKKKTVKGTESSIDIPVKLSNKQEWRYFCDVLVADQPEHYVSSNEAVIVLECAWFVEQPKQNYVALTGSELKLSCKVETTPDVTVEYHWFKCQQDGNGRQPTKCYEYEMVLLTVEISNRGYYVCGVTAKNKTIYSDVTHVEVVNSTPITVDVQLPSDRCVEFKEELVLEFKTSCKHYPVRYQWYYNGKELAGTTGPTLTIPSVAEENIGSYYCEASSDYSAKSVMSKMCRIHLKGVDSNLSTIQHQQNEAEEQLKLGGRFHATDKMALLIGNSDYKMNPLKCSRNDVEAMTKKFRQLNFKTISLVDLTLSQMDNAVEYFCSLLDSGMYAVFFFSGHGVEYNNITYLMPTDADVPLKLEQCIDSRNISMKMQKTLSKVIMIFDCCRVSIENQTTPKLLNASVGFSNIVQMYACAPSLETYESKDNPHSYMTQAFLQVLDRPESIWKVYKLACKCYNTHDPQEGKSVPRMQLFCQMDQMDDISFHDPILNDSKLKNYELLLVLPNDCHLEFTHPKLKKVYGAVELRFTAKFSNVLLVHVVCNADLQPEVNGVGLTAELECSVHKEDNKAMTSFKISNLLDVVQNENSKLQISFQMPQDSWAKETIEYKIPTELIKPTFYHH